MGLQRASRPFYCSTRRLFQPDRIEGSRGRRRPIKSRGVKRSVIGKAARLFLETFDQLHDLMRDPEKRAILLKERKFHEFQSRYPYFTATSWRLREGSQFWPGNGKM